ncbi:hypothetical protein [Beijerinckia sp. L45]|uniref:hypothetical protein n=1 Tax=Beijerinckia sp. L45 TaxID=1641855 RepID=UPI00131DE600|nr:hypothetical protein [Beijerinckia sp. L45]
MRPRTVAEACRRGQSQEALNKAMGEFLDEYYGASSDAERTAMLADEPALFVDDRYNALVGGIAEFLYKRWTPDAPPDWIGKPERYLKEPWFPSAMNQPALKEYLTYCSPSEFKSRNIMTDAQPLRRASQRGRSSRVS